MEVFNEDQKSGARLLWYNFLQVIYGFPPAQRIILVFGLIAIIPGYWLVRISATAYFNWSYSKNLVVAHRSFESASDPEVTNSQIFPVSGGRGLAYAKLYNPNLELSGYSVPYTISVLNDQQDTVYSTTGSTYILPGGDQYITTETFSTSLRPSIVKVEFGTIQWQKRFSIPEVKLGTPAVTYQDTNEGLRLEGSVVNNSPYELGAVNMTFFIYDQSNRLSAVIQREERTVKPRERRTFPQIWPGVISASNVGRIISVASTNPLNSRNLNAESVAPSQGTPTEN